MVNKAHALTWRGNVNLVRRRHETVSRTQFATRHRIHPAS